MHLNGQFSKADIQIINRYMRRYSASLIIREMQAKTTVRNQFIPVRNAVTQKRRESKYLVRMWGEKGPLVR